MRLSSVVEFWTRKRGVIRSNSSRVKKFVFFHAAAMLLSYIIQRIIFPKSCIFRKFITIHHCMALLQLALYRSQLTSLFVRHVGITDYRKLKSTILG
jgi:hypothetical protein